MQAAISRSISTDTLDALKRFNRAIAPFPSVEQIDDSDRLKIVQAPDEPPVHPQIEAYDEATGQWSTLVVEDLADLIDQIDKIDYEKLRFAWRNDGLELSFSTAAITVVGGAIQAHSFDTTVRESSQVLWSSVGQRRTDFILRGLSIPRDVIEALKGPSPAHF